MPPLYGLWVWFRNNPAAQVAAAVVAGIVVFFGWLGLHDRKVRREDRLKAEIKTRKAVDKYVETVTKEEAHEADQALEARDSAQPLDPDGMSDAQYERIFGRRRGPAQSG